MLSGPNNQVFEVKRNLPSVKSSEFLTFLMKTSDDNQVKINAAKKLVDQTSLADLSKVIDQVQNRNFILENNCSLVARYFSGLVNAELGEQVQEIGVLEGNNISPRSTIKYPYHVVSCLKVKGLYYLLDATAPVHREDRVTATMIISSDIKDLKIKASEIFTGNWRFSSLAEGNEVYQDLSLIETQGFTPYRRIAEIDFKAVRECLNLSSVDRLSKYTKKRFSGVEKLVSDQVMRIANPEMLQLFSKELFPLMQFNTYGGVVSLCTNCNGVLTVETVPAVSFKNIAKSVAIGDVLAADYLEEKMERMPTDKLFTFEKALLKSSSIDSYVA